MPTLVSSANIWFSALHRRWLTPDESLVTQGFPVRLTQSGGVVCCSFAARDAFVKGGEIGFNLNEFYDDANARACLASPPSRTNVFKMAGNSMHTNVSGVIMPI